jgi:DNA polymerase V
MRHYNFRVAAGRPAIAGEGRAKRVEVNGLLNVHSGTDFAFAVSGNDMATDGIADRDRLIVDPSAKPKDGSLVVAEVDGNLVVRRVRREKRGLTLHFPESEVPSIDCGSGRVHFLGVVHTVIRPQ